MVTLEELKPTWRDGAYTLFGVLLDRFGINYAIKKSKGYIDQSMEQATDRVAEKLVSRIQARESGDKLYNAVQDLSNKVADLEKEVKAKGAV
jgi:hypothetical protein